MARRAFTLVELLVVIAIIALLISILAPSLKTAKDLTKQLICMTHLRSIGSAAILYAEGNKEKLPPRGDDGMVGGVALHGSDDAALQPFYLPVTFGLQDDGLHGSLQDDGTLARGMPLGYFYSYKLLEADTLYCPLQLNGRFTRSSYPDPYGFAPVHQKQIVSSGMSCSYMFNTVLHPGSDGAWRWTCMRLPEYPADGVLAVDIFLRPWEVAHTFTGEKTPTWAMVYPDGHALTRMSERAFAHMSQYAGGIGYWAGPDWPGWNTGFGYLVGITDYKVSPR